MLSRYSSKEEPLEMELTSGLPETELFSGFTVTKVTSELPELPEKSLNLKPPETDLCVEKPSCSGDSHVLADSVSLILILLQGGLLATFKGSE